MKILVVDDSSTMRRIIINALKSFIKEIEIVEAEDGVVGLEKVKEHNNFDIILSDINMPNMNGFDFLKGAITFGVKCPIVMITTESEKSQVVKAIQLGAKNYVTKPFTPDIIKTKISQTLGISI